MPIKRISFYQPQSTAWNWPLKIGVLKKSSEFIETLSSGYWTKEFTLIENISSENNKVNILYLENDLYSLQYELEKISFTSDIVILNGDDSYFKDELDSIHNNKILAAIAAIIKASGVFKISVNDNIEQWLNALIIELSHNQCLPIALEKVCDDGFALCDPKLERETKLDYLLEDILRTTHSLEDKYPEKIRLKSRLLSHQVYTLEQLRFEILGNEQYFRYDHESGEAQGIKQLIESLNAHFKFDILDQRKRYLSSSSSSNDGQTRGGPIKKIPPLLDELLNKMSASSSGSEPDEIESIKETPRYLQSIFRDASNNIVDSLFVSTAYKVIVRIGEFSKKWTQDKDHIIPTDKIFIDPSSQQETLQIQFKSNLSKTIQSAEITLHKTDDSEEAEFNILTATNPIFLEAEIFVYHKNRLIQKALLTADILDANANPDKYPSPQLSIDLKLVSDLENLNQHKPFHTSIGGHQSNKMDEPIPGISNQSPIDLNFSSALQTLMLTIKNRIQQAAIDTKEYPEDLYAENNQTLLLQLALDGNDLFVNHLKQFNQFEGPIQIISYKDEFIPLDFVYTFATPNIDAQVCEHASEALLKGKCCGCKEINETPCSLVCPFGFLGLSHVIEHHSIEKYKSKKSDGEYQVLAEPGNQCEPLSILKNTLYATSSKVVKANPNLAEEIKSAFKKNTQHSIAASSWNDWTSKIETENPDSLILIVHIEKEERSDRFQLEIGKEDFKIKNLIDKSQISSKNAKQPPFIVLIGCEAVELDYYGFDISSQLMNYGAAIVISNFTKIRGRHAGPIVMKLLEFLKAHEEKEFTLGEIVLKLRQYLLAKGIMVGFSLTTLGDADWKIKIA